MPFSKGYQWGFEKLHPLRHRLVYVPLWRADIRSHKLNTTTPHDAYIECIPDATTRAADQAATLTDSVAGVGGMPADGSIRGLRVLMIAQNSTVNDHNFYTVDYDSLNYGRGGECHFGKQAGDYNTEMIDVRTDGRGRFYWGLAWTAGTATLYLRAMGYWREANL